MKRLQSLMVLPQSIFKAIVMDDSKLSCLYLSIKTKGEEHHVFPKKTNQL